MGFWLLKLEDLQNKHKGRVAFVLGAGPSLHYCDVKKIRKRIIFTVNSAIMKAPWCKYFVSDDWAVTTWSYWNEYVATSKAKKLLFKDKYHKRHNPVKIEDIIWFHHKIWFDCRTGTKRKGGLTITKEANLPIIGARNSVATAIHLAYIMGVRTVVLVGCDCQYDGRYRYFWELSNEWNPIRTKRIPEASLRIKRQQGRYLDCHCRESIEYWNDFAPFAKDAGLRVVDASNGRLTMFEQMDFEEAVKLK